MSTTDTMKISDVARHSGVSVTTVSRFLNDSDKVKPSTRSRIRTAIETLGYVPNGAARTLASSRSHVVGAIVPTLDHALFARELSAIEERLAKSGYNLIVASSNYDPEQENALVRQMLSRHVDGLVLVGTDRKRSSYDLLAQRGVPYVTTWATSKEPAQPEIGVDNYQAAFDVTRYLLSLKHERFGLILLSSEGNDRARARLEGIKDALESRGIILPKDALIERPINYLEGQIGIRYLLGLANPPTAVVCGSDVFAVGATLECKRLGVAIPQELSIVSFDNAELAPLLDPPLTTVDLPVKEIGVRAAEHLLGTISGQTMPIQTVLGHQLIMRGSAAEAAR